MKVKIYTDGSARGNPGPGGWAAILIYGDNKKEISGGSPETILNDKCGKVMYQEDIDMLIREIEDLIENYQSNDCGVAGIFDKKN